jgi:recombination DNA repair RAD52 pathway protein
MTLTPAQVNQLLQPVNPRRVLADGKGHSHLSQQDVVAHLIRVFGFGHFTIEVLDVGVVYEKPRDPAKTGARDRWDVCYRAGVRLTVFDEAHEAVAFYDDYSTGEALNSVLSDAHDLALKSAISVAKKRAAINLGDQFGLSLYNKGQTEALVMGTLNHPPGWEPYLKSKQEQADDVQKDVPKQETLGTDETVYNDHLNKGPDEDVTPEQKKILEETLGATEVKK